MRNYIMIHFPRLKEKLKALVGDSDKIPTMKYTEGLNLMSDSPWQLAEEERQQMERNMKQDSLDSNSTTTITVPVDDSVDRFYSTEFADKSVRLGFIQKMYSIVMVQQLITFCISFGLKKEPWIGQYVLSNLWILLIPIFAMFITFIFAVYWEAQARKAPFNYILLMVYTISLSCLVGLIGSYDYNELILALTITTFASVLSTILFAFQTKVKLGVLQTIFFFIFPPIASMVITIMTMTHQWESNNFVMFSSMLAIISVIYIYIYYHTYFILNGFHCSQIKANECIFAALLIYIDVVRCFALLCTCGRTILHEDADKPYSLN